MRIYSGLLILCLFISLNVLVIKSNETMEKVESTIQIMPNETQDLNGTESVKQVLLNETHVLNDTVTVSQNVLNETQAVNGTESVNQATLSETQVLNDTDVTNETQFLNEIESENQSIQSDSEVSARIREIINEYRKNSRNVRSSQLEIIVKILRTNDDDYIKTLFQELKIILIKARNDIITFGTINEFFQSSVFNQTIFASLINLIENTLFVSEIAIYNTDMVPEMLASDADFSEIMKWSLQVTYASKFYTNDGLSLLEASAEIFKFNITEEAYETPYKVYLTKEEEERQINELKENPIEFQENETYEFEDQIKNQNEATDDKTIDFQQEQPIVQEDEQNQQTEQKETIVHDEI